MYRIKVLAFVVVGVLLGGAFATATAQKAELGTGEMPIPISGPLSGTYVSTLNADEVSAGETEHAVAKTFGWTGYGKTTGDLSGFMFVSMNFSVPQRQSSDATIRPGAATLTSKVSSGSGQN